MNSAENVTFGLFFCTDNVQTELAVVNTILQSIKLINSIAVFQDFATVADSDEKKETHLRFVV
jgi:hypothetical protein